MVSGYKKGCRITRHWCHVQPPTRANNDGKSEHKDRRGGPMSANSMRPLVHME